MSLEERAYRVDLIAEISAACVKVALEYGSDASAKARETESNAAFLERLKRIHTLCEELLVVSDDTISSYGIRVANYKELCKLLEEPVKAGNSKKAQLKDFEKYFAYEKDKNAYIITEIYDVPQLKEDGRQKYLQLLEPIILNYLAMKKGCHLESWNKWFQKFGMINPEFYDESCGEAERLYWSANPHSLFLLRNIAKNRMKEILSGTLSNMKKRGPIDYTEGWNVVSVTGFSYFKTKAEATIIKRIYQEVMSEMGYTISSEEILTEQKMEKQFYDYSPNSMVSIATSSSGAVMLEVVGKNKANGANSKTAVRMDMERFCPDYERIKEGLKAYGIIMADKKLFPPDEKYVRFIDSNTDHNRRVSVKKKSMRMGDE